MTCYGDIDKDVEYLNISDRKLKVEGLIDILNDLEDDTVLKQIDLSYNISADEAHIPSRLPKILSKLALALNKNKTLYALDFVGNHLGKHILYKYY